MTINKQFHRTILKTVLCGIPVFVTLTGGGGGCIAHEVGPATEPQREASEFELDAEPSQPVRDVDRRTPVSAPSDCPDFRTPDIAPELAAKRLRYLDHSAATMTADDPALAEHLLWIAELSLMRGRVPHACAAMHRLAEEAAPSDAHPTAACWSAALCETEEAVQCSAKHVQDGAKGCAPDAKCAADPGGNLQEQVAGACDAGDAACCVVESNIEQANAIYARREGDNVAVRRAEHAMAALLERSCKLGTAGSCAFLAEQYRNGRGAPNDAESRADALEARACSLGHLRSCSEG